MNARVFRQNVFVVIAIYSLAIVIGVGLKILDPSNKDAVAYGTFKDIIPLIIAIPAAWLSYCFQRRQAYLKDVRDLWSKMVGSFQDAVQYTHLNAPEQQEYARVLKSLSATIEEIRAVFANVGAEEINIGLFPFESIKQMRDEIADLGFGKNFKGETAKPVRDKIVACWKKLRTHFLLELERDIPVKVDSPFLH